MSTQPPGAQPQGAWVREVVRDLTGGQPEQSPPPVAPAEPAEPTTRPEPQAEPHPVPRRSSPDQPAPVGGHAVDGFAAADLGGRIRHGESRLARVTRWVRTNVAAGQQDARLAELLEAVRRPVTTGRRIAVAGVRGGVGTTTVALLLGSVLAGRRDDAVLAVDADPELGSLLWRTCPQEDRPAGTIEQELQAAHLSSIDQLESLLPRTAAGLWVLPTTTRPESERVPAGARALEPQPSAPPELREELSRFFAVSVLDCGGELVGQRAPDAALATAHAAVVVAAATVDGVRAAQRALRPGGEPIGAAEMPARVVALVSRTPRSEGLRIARARRLLEGADVDVVHLPYDRHLAAGGAVDPSRLAEATLLAATDLAGRVLDLARRPPITAGDGQGRGQAGGAR